MKKKVIESDVVKTTGGISKAAANNSSKGGVSALPPSSRTGIQRTPEEESAVGAPQTDNSLLIPTGVLSVSPDRGTTDEPHPAAGVDYYFTLNILNAARLPSGPFLVRFVLSGHQDPPLNLDVSMENGLDPGENEMAVVHFGRFPNEFGVYHLDACIYSPGAPDRPISCFPSGNDYTIFTQ